MPKCQLIILLRARPTVNYYALLRIKPHANREDVNDCTVSDPPGRRIAIPVSPRFGFLGPIFQDQRLARKPIETGWTEQAVTWPQRLDGRASAHR